MHLWCIGYNLNFPGAESSDFFYLWFVCSFICLFVWSYDPLICYSEGLFRFFGLTISKKRLPASPSQVFIFGNVKRKLTSFLHFPFFPPEWIVPEKQNHLTTSVMPTYRLLQWRRNLLRQAQASSFDLFSVLRTLWQVDKRTLINCTCHVPTLFTTTIWVFTLSHCSMTLVSWTPVLQSPLSVPTQGGSKAALPACMQPSNSKQCCFH